MTLNHCFRIRNLVLASALITGLGLVTHATAQERSFLVDLNSRTATVLGTLGGDYSEATGINDAGQVVGESRTAEGFIAFITGPDGTGMRDLGALDLYYSSASDINDAGQVVGWSPSDEGPPHAFITGPDGMGMRDLGAFVGDASYSEATGINDAGQVVGQSVTENHFHGFITDPNGGRMRDLGTLHGFDSHAYDINDAGQVVGNSDGLAFITGPDGMGMRDLGTLGGHGSEAFGINDAGQVVGYDYTSLWTGDMLLHPFITGPNGEGMVDLNSLVDLPQGVILTEAIDINNSGQVIAVGIIPEPETYALMLAGLGLIGFTARLKKSENRV